MTRNNLFLSTLILLSLSAPALAQDKVKEEPKKTAAPAKPADKKPVKESVVKVESTPGEPTGALKKWIDAENALIDPLSDKDKDSFLLLREKYSMIKAIGIVEHDIGSAVKSCGKANPDIRDKMEARFKQWQNAVTPIIDTAKTQFDKDLSAQKIVDVGKAKNVLKLQDEAFAEKEKTITKQYATEKSRCEDLVESMDDTEDDMISRLQATLLPESVIRKRTEDVRKERGPSAGKPAADRPKN